MEDEDELEEWERAEAVEAVVDLSKPGPVGERLAALKIPRLRIGTDRDMSPRLECSGRHAGFRGKLQCSRKL